MYPRPPQWLSSKRGASVGLETRNWKSNPESSIKQNSPRGGVCFFKVNSSLVFRHARFSFEEFLIEQRLPALHRHLPALDEDVAHLGLRFKNIAVANKEVGRLAYFDGTVLCAHAHDLGRNDGNGLQGFIFIHTIRGGE